MAQGSFSAQVAAKRPPTMKVLLLGDSGVGKSSLMMRFAANTYSDESNPTIGIDFRVKQLDLGPEDGGVVNLQLWDTAGQERFRTLTSSYYRGAHAMVFVFDITRPDTLESVKTWMQEALSYAGPTSEHVIMVLVANKIDCYASSHNNGGGGSSTSEGAATTADETTSPPGAANAMPANVDPSLLTPEAEEALRRKADAFARENRMIYARCSAKTKEGVGHLFENIARNVVQKPAFSGGLYTQEREGAVRLRQGAQPPKVDGNAAGCLC